MENQQHLLDTIGPMYVNDLQKKQQEQQAISAQTVNATPQETTVAAA
jgi:hypothetical protein